MDEQQLLRAIAGHSHRIEREAMYIRGQVYYFSIVLTLFLVLSVLGTLMLFCAWRDRSLVAAGTIRTWRRVVP